MTGIRRSVATRWLGGGALLLAVSYGIVRWVDTRPSFDAYGWLVWGYQTIHGSLDLSGAPTWKPLTWLFTTPYALFGQSGEMWLWMTTAVALSLAGVLFAGRAAHRLATLAGLPDRAAWLAAATAGGALLGFQDYPHYVLSAQSDPVIVMLCLLALDCGLRGRRRLALVALTLAGLGRPEAWPVLGLYALWLWRRSPELRWFIAVDLLVVPLLWFGVPEITNGKALIGAQTALNSPRALHHGQIRGTIGRFRTIEVLPVGILALVAAGWAARRREPRVLALTGAVGLWVLTEIAFAYRGWAALPRYMWEAAAGEAVLAGVGAGALVAGLLEPGRIVRLAGPVLAAIALLACVPYAVSHIRAERSDLVLQHHRTRAVGELATVVNDLGGARAVTRCGRPVTSVRFVSALAYLTHDNINIVGHHPNRELKRRHASVFFLSLNDGWSVLPWHLHRRSRHRCEHFKGAFVFLPGRTQPRRQAYIHASFG